MEVLEQAFGRLDGVKSAKARGFRTPDKYFYELSIQEKTVLLPEQLEALAKKLEDYPFMGLWYKDLTGTLEKSGETLTFSARGSGRKFEVVPDASLKKLQAEGRTAVLLTGKVVQAKGGLPKIEVESARELK